MKQQKKRFGSDEENLLAARLIDLSNRAERTGYPQYTDFLSQADRSFCLSITGIRQTCDLQFTGGYPDAERTMAVLLPFDYGDQPDPPITVLAVKYKGEKLSHRDILGSVMALGIKRQKIGDILVSGQAGSIPLIFCDAAISQYVIDHLERIGRDRVEICVSDISSLPLPEKKTMSFTVMSLRLDSVLASAFHLPRSTSSEMIQKGGVFLNWKECLSPSRNLAAGDNVTLRGHGKLIVSSIGGFSRKGRTYVEVEIYR